MKTIAGGVALLGALALCGCADQEESLIVLHSPAWNDDGACAVDADSDASLALGVLDVSQHTPYILPAIVQNQLVSDTTSSTGIENGEMQLRDVDVKLSMPQDPDIIDALAAEDEGLVDFTVTLPTVSIPPQGRQGVLVEAIPRRASELLDQELGGLPEGSRPVVNIELVFHARRTGNAVGGIGEISAREYIFPVQLCQGCLFSCAGCEGGACPAEFSGVVGGVCGNAQDRFYGPAACEDPNSAGGG